MTILVAQEYEELLTHQAKAIWLFCSALCMLQNKVGVVITDTTCRGYVLSAPLLCEWRQRPNSDEKTSQPDHDINDVNYQYLLAAVSCKKNTIIKVSQ